jgi:precorrin-8X/cobalt-precorrin-8 methylmutase
MRGSMYARGVEQRTTRPHCSGRGHGWKAFEMTGEPTLQWPVPGGLLERLGRRPDEIEARSRSLAAEATARWPGPDAELAAACIYAAGDIGIADRLSIGGNPAEKGAAALGSGARVLVDVGMARAGATRVETEIGVAVGTDGSRELAARAGTTRAAAGMCLAWDHFGRDGVVVVGNAPTALLAALDLAVARGRPACVIATCPGFTLAEEAKNELAASDLPHVALRGTRGGSGMAVAMLNALAKLAREDP